MNEDKMEHMTDDDADDLRAQRDDLTQEVTDLEAQVEALTVVQNQKCATCTLLGEQSKKVAELMSKLNACSSERATLQELNREAAVRINDLVNAADQEHIKVIKLTDKVDVQKLRMKGLRATIEKQAKEITRLNEALENCTKLAAANVVEC